MQIEISIKELYEQGNKITGVIVSSMTIPANDKDRYEMESIMKHHIHDKIFPNRSIVFYPTGSNPGIVSFIALININNMPERREEIDYTLIFSSNSKDFS